LQLSWTLAHIDAGDGAFTEPDRSVTCGLTVPREDAGDELVQIGIVTYDQNPFPVGVLPNELLEGGIIPGGSEHRRGEDLRFEANLCGDKLGRLKRSLERAGDDDIDLNVERSQDTGRQHALLLPILDKAALGIEDWIFAGNPGIGMAH